MSEKQETLADVLAEMKSRETLDGSDMGVDNFRLEDGEYGGFDALPLFKAYADRIEAAAERERAELEADALSVGGVVEAARHKPSGNTAAMREALTKVSEWMAHRIATCGFEASATVPTMLEGVVLPALAAPPRNCDRFGGDIDKLREACLRERGLNPEEDFPDVFADWLLAPATAKEGDSDGSK